MRHCEGCETLCLPLASVIWDLDSRPGVDNLSSLEIDDHSTSTRCIFVSLVL